MALDSEGRPVTDLHQSDFQVIDNGQPRPITSFQAIAGEPQGRPAATVVLFDVLNLKTTIKDPSWGQLVRALEGRESGDRLYLYILADNGELFPVREFPADSAQDEATDPHWNRQIRVLLEDAARKLIQLKWFKDMTDLRVTIPTTYQAIEDLGSRMERLSGRKNLVWVSSGLPIRIHAQGTMAVDEWTELTPFLWRLSAQLDAAHIAVYTVGQRAQGDSAPLNPVDKETLDLISSLTGGRYYPTDMIDKAITQALADARARYVIGYEPAPWKLDNKYHKIRVTCARKGVLIHSKEGYYGIPSRAPVGLGSGARGPGKGR